MSEVRYCIHGYTYDHDCESDSAFEEGLVFVCLADMTEEDYEKFWDEA